MNRPTRNKWIMYHEIHQRKRDGQSITSIANELVLDWRTVKNHLDMSEADYEQFLLGQQERTKKLSAYEDFVKSKLSEHQETGASQMHDWLKEYHPDLLDVPQKTVYNFIQFIRHKYNIPYQKAVREYMIVDECDYGKQTQVDFGQYNMRTEDGTRKKVWFFTMVLSRSRKKFVYFSEKAFTTQTAIDAHEKSFNHFSGIPVEVVYDQDRLFISDENSGKLILTEGFKSYVRMREFSLHFCRKADPASKGKIENVVKYVKQNFLYNREFCDIDTLNQQAIAWLARTANAVVHARTKKIPEQEWLIERHHLKSFVSIPAKPSVKIYHVRKDNSINYHGNFYTLPQGTYKGAGTQVSVQGNEYDIEIFDTYNQFLCKHTLSNEKGRTIINTDHLRDKSEKINTMIEQVASLFSDKDMAVLFMEQIRNKKPRYIRDQILLLRKTIEKYSEKTISETLFWCVENKIFDAVDFNSVAESFACSACNVVALDLSIKLMNPESIEQANMCPQKSSIANYENIFTLHKNII